MTAITTPTPTVRQISGPDAAGFCLSVLAKRTYQVLPSGDCVPADDQVPLCAEPVHSPDDKNLLVEELDLIPRKPRTDVIVRGHAYAGTPKPGVEAKIQVGKHKKELLVVGRRLASLSSTGAVLFSSAEPFERMPLTFAHAYGGRDRAAEQRYGNPFAPYAKYFAGTEIDADNQSPYLYPRNPSGKGYLIEATREALEQYELPNLEDPLDLLDPSRLATGDVDNWYRMPLPQATGWINWGWFPRAAFGGLMPDLPADKGAITEVARGLMTKDMFEIKDRATPPEHVYRFANGAPLDLQLPLLGGDEAVELTGLHPKHRQRRFKLPGRPARMATDGREGKMNSVTPVLQTLLMEPDLDRITLVWQGSAPARRPYMPDELARMPLLVEW